MLLNNIIFSMLISIINNISISTVTLIFIQLYTSIFKLVAKKPEIIFIYFVKIHDFIIIQDAEVFIEYVFLSQSLIIPVLPPGMDEV